MDFGEGVKTDAQLTYPAIGNGSFPGILLITGSGAEDMNETAERDQVPPNSVYNTNNDTQINIETELKPVLVNHAKSFFMATKTETAVSAGNKCTNLEGCPVYSNSFLNFEPNKGTIGSVPSNTSILILNGENDTQTPVQGALLLQQKLTQLKHPDHALITYPNLGHEFHPSSQWFTQQGSIPEYVLADLYA